MLGKWDIEATKLINDYQGHGAVDALPPLPWLARSLMARR